MQQQNKENALKGRTVYVVRTSNQRIEKKITPNTSNDKQK